MDTITITKGNTTYELKESRVNWFIFQRTVKNSIGSDAGYSLKESLSINLDSREVYCNRTGKETHSFNTWLNLKKRIEKIFDIDNLDTVN